MASGLCKELEERGKRGREGEKEVEEEEPGNK